MKFQIVTEIELSQDEFDLLQKIDKCGGVEYCDCELETIHDFENFNRDNTFPLEWYLKRNFGGTLLIARELSNKNLLASGSDCSWNLTYVVSKMGKLLIEQNKIN